MKIKLKYIVPVQNTLGEGVLWDGRSGAFWWTDIQNCKLHRFILENEKLDIFQTPERLCAFGFTDEEGLLVAAFESGYASFRPETGDIQWIRKPFDGVEGLRFNDGRVDPAGRFWCGTMAEDGKSETIQKSKLFCLNEAMEVSAHISDIHIANSLCWSPDGKYMYFADSPKQQIQRYDFDMANGACSNARIFASTTGSIAPDGSVTDAQGYLWNAQWDGSRVVRYAPDGTIDFILEMPVSQPTCVAFGGPSLDLLCITTAQENLSDDALKSQPQAGNLFIYQVDANGLPAPMFKGKLS
ncbi:MAG: gluconolaconase [Alphaproteobacteria bacterium]|nr:MAG: gluconolaconase [Alphaproteobacteria bacterium]